MKNILTFLIAILLPCFTYAGGTTTTSAPTQIDAERAAAAFVSQATAYFYGGSYLEQTQPDGSFTSVSTQFTVVKGKIVQLRVFSDTNPKEGKEITIPEGGLPGFPRNFVGETRNFQLWLNGYTDSGIFASYGNFYKALFKSNDNIAIELRPSDRLKKIAFPANQIPAGVSPGNLTLEYTGSNGSSSSSSYNDYIGGFQLYIDPLSGGTYKLYDSSTGFIYPFDISVNGPSEFAGINTTLIGGPVEIDFGSQNWKGYSNILFDSVVERGGNMVAAKTYFTDLADVYGLVISTGNFVGTVEVFSVDQDGVPTLVKTVTFNSGQYWSSVQVPAGYGPVVVTFIGGMQSPYYGWVHIQFSRSEWTISTTTGG
ncbi:MAG: hypothetical protein WCF92_02860 [bacterium]